MKQLLFFFLISLTTFAQNDSINLLDEVKLHGNFSKKLNAGYQIKVLKEETLNNSVQSLGDLLQNQANLYFKENGKGMVSSISLRGSGASHTGVYWNGIAINSSLNGQTDFNTLSANGFNQIEIRKGAGTTLFGSGAIGGAINLVDKIQFIPKKELNTNIGIGSYNTQNLFLQGRYSTKKYDAKVSVDGMKSDNNYPFFDTELVNENGYFNNYQVKSAFGYKINKNNQLKLFGNYSNNYRELSRTITAPSKNLYTNQDKRLLLNWINFGSKYNSNLNFVYLGEEYKFYLDKDLDGFSYGNTHNYMIKYDFSYFLKNRNSIKIGLENKLTKGDGSSILKKERNTFETYGLYHQTVGNKFTYNLSFRKGFSNVYNIPLIYATDTRFDLSNKVNLRANYSTNYKLPTFNDLYWEFAGNEDLLAENSNSLEFGIYFQTKKTNINITAYRTKSNDLIQWRPVSSSQWKPLNIQNVNSEGIEFNFDYRLKFNNHQFKFQTQYTYTSATDENLDKQLIYVPFHVGNFNLTYHYKTWSFFGNFHYNGSVYTTTSNTQKIDNYTIFNIQFHKQLVQNKINIGFYINNLFNKYYEIVNYRPMPNRNYKLNIKIKI
jgi:iron complex outermembrane receptor protein